MTDRAHLLAQTISRLRHGAGSEFSTALTGEMCQMVLVALDQCERYRVALQDVQGIALNGVEVGDTVSDRLDAIDARVAAATA